MSVEKMQSLVSEMESLREDDEYISFGDMPFHQFLVEELRRLEAAKDFWMMFLTQKYNLQSEDIITPAGEIKRHQS